MTEQEILLEQAAAGIASPEQAALCAKRSPLLLLSRFQANPFITEAHVWEAIRRSSRRVLEKLQKPGITQWHAVALLLAAHPEKTHDLDRGPEILAASQQLAARSI